MNYNFLLAENPFNDSEDYVIIVSDKTNDYIIIAEETNIEKANYQYDNPNGFIEHYYLHFKRDYKADNLILDKAWEFFDKYLKWEDDAILGEEIPF
jgi:hypothetical protein